MPHSKGFGNRRDTRSSDPIAIGDIVDGLLQEDLFSRGMPIANLLRAWPGIVGERLAEATTPVSLGGWMSGRAGRRRTLGSQAKYLADEIRTRADDALGGGTVTSIRITVGDARNRRSEG